MIANFFKDETPEGQKCEKIIMSQSNLKEGYLKDLAGRLEAFDKCLGDNPWLCGAEVRTYASTSQKLARQPLPQNSMNMPSTQFTLITHYSVCCN